MIRRRDFENIAFLVTLATAVVMFWVGLVLVLKAIVA